ncbi:MAG: FAD-binding oxidoreductase [Ilumatobacter sp.]|uniref:FAD-binding oxidoreductase n=1 Tax=Ilumatobacter sp. TaxID=1967498 RepID=UPI00374EDF11|nr:FAD-binding oxidoreductase [Ilumatobacter sp.]
MQSAAPIDMIEELTVAVGAAHVLVDDDVRAGYEVDWTGRYQGPCRAVVRPDSVEEVAAVIRICAQHDVAVVPQAGNTGLVGGSVPRPAASGARAAIVLSLIRLTRLGAVDTAAMQVTVEAGVTFTTWREQARHAGLDTPVDFAARDTATIGGAIATNAGGSRVLRFGTMRQQVVGIEAVTAEGAIVGSLGGLPKETAGLHWPSLLAGSEGTLAVITAARLRLVPWFQHTTTALVAVESVAAGTRLLATLRQSLTSLDAVEVIAPAAMRLVSEHLGRQPPVSSPEAVLYVIIDCADHGDPSEQLLDVLSQADGIIDSAVTTDAVQRERLVAFRDRITEAIAAASTEAGVPTFKLDVAVPLDALAQLIEVAQDAADADGCRLIPFGHLAEANLHLNHIGASHPERIADTVLKAVASLGGTISAEHGIGVAKAPWLHLIRNPAELAAQAAIRAALDPAGMLNPGVLQP